MDEVFFGYVYVSGRQGGPERLEGIQTLEAFIKQFIFCEELRITDALDNLVLHILDGVELFNTLSEFGFDLSETLQADGREYQVQRRDSPKAHKLASDRKSSRMLRDRKSPSKSSLSFENALTVSDVACLLDGTSFTVLFESKDGSQAWGDFNPHDYSVIPMEEMSSGNSKPKPQRVFLDPTARVQHDGSSADIQIYILVDLP